MRGLFVYATAVSSRFLKIGTDQPVRLGPDRRFHPMNTGGFPLSRQWVYPVGSLGSVRPRLLSETKSSHLPPLVDGSDLSHRFRCPRKGGARNSPTIDGKASFRPGLADPPNPTDQWYLPRQANSGKTPDFREFIAAPLPRLIPRIREIKCGIYSPVTLANQFTGTCVCLPGSGAAIAATLVPIATAPL